MKKIYWFLLILYFGLLIFSRFYNISHTARFTEDESGFMVRVHQIFVERKITLVGQINDQGTKVFSSLTVYLLLPFAIIGRFSAQSVFYGAAFFGLLTAFVLLYLTKRINNKITFISALLIFVWYPLVLTGRWAWNPNFIPLWVALGIICYLNKTKVSYFLSGVAFGLSVHQHYYAIFGISFFIFLVILELLLKKKVVNAFLMGIGTTLMIIPFVVFDLRHPPGIFLLGAAGQASHTQISNLYGSVMSNIYQVLTYFVQMKVLVIPLALLIFVLIIIDLTKKSKSLIYLLPCIFQVVVISAIAPFFIHYFYVTIVFFFVYLIYKRKGIAKVISTLIVLLFIVGSVSKITNLLTVSPVQPSLTTVEKITKIIEGEIEAKEMKNVNLTSLASPDMNTYGKKYRDLLLVDDVRLLTSDQYPITDNLFVISTSPVSQVLKDKAYEVSSFRNGVVKNTWQVDNWYIYLLNKR